MKTKGEIDLGGEKIYCFLSANGEVVSATKMVREAKEWMRYRKVGESVAEYRRTRIATRSRDVAED